MKPKFFTKDVALITFATADEFSDGYAVVERPRYVTYHGVGFIEGIHSQDSSRFVRGRRVLFPLMGVTSITEFDRASEVYRRGSKPKGRRLD
jgi:hypothetical protein